MNNDSYGMYTDEGDEALHKIILEVRDLSCPLEMDRTEFVSTALQERLVALNSTHIEWIDTAVREEICDAFNDILGHSCWNIEFS